jgi:hypothetical protein
MRLTCLTYLAFLSISHLGCETPTASSSRQFSELNSNRQTSEFNANEHLPIRVVSLADEWKRSGKDYFKGVEGLPGHQKAVPNSFQYYAIEYEAVFVDRLRELLSHYVEVVPKDAPTPSRCITYKIVAVHVTSPFTPDLSSSFDIPNQGMKSLGFGYKVKVYRSGEIEPIRIYSESAESSHMGELVSMAAGKEGPRLMAEANKKGQIGLRVLIAEALARSFFSRLKRENREVQWSYSGIPISYSSFNKPFEIMEPSKFSKSDQVDFINYNRQKILGSGAFGGKIIDDY